MVEADLDTGRLSPVLTAHIPVRRTIYAIYAASRLLPAKPRAFLDVLETSVRIRRPATEEIYDS
jgi:DNA-binding transcriptional LysR family regulator